MNTYLGIDPGKAGALAVLTGSAAVYDLPHPSNELDYEALYELVAPYKGALVVLEEQHPQGRTERTAAGGYRITGSMQSAFQLGKGYGGCLAVCRLAGLRIHRVKPNAWKSAMGLTSEKDLSLTKARDLFPELSRELRFKTKDGRAEALLLALYGKDRLSESGATRKRAAPPPRGEGGPAFDPAVAALAKRLLTRRE